MLALALAAVGFVTGLVVAPAWAARGSVAGWVFELGCSRLCHQLPSRTLATLFGPMAVCARCFGLYLGGAGALLAAAVAVWFGGWPRPSRWLLLALAPTGADAAVYLLTGVGLGNLPRAVVSIPAGWVLGLFLAEGLGDGMRLAARGRGDTRRWFRAGSLAAARTEEKG